jgi:hypothetical protein
LLVQGEGKALFAIRYLLDDKTEAAQALFQARADVVIVLNEQNTDVRSPDCRDLLPVQAEFALTAYVQISVTSSCSEDSFRGHPVHVQAAFDNRLHNGDRPDLAGTSAANGSLVDRRAREHRRH